MKKKLCVIMDFYEDTHEDLQMLDWLSFQNISFEITYRLMLLDSACVTIINV